MVTQIDIDKHRIWETWDWDKPDSYISRRVGVSRERVRQIRRDLGKPKSNFFGKREDTINFVESKDKFNLNGKTIKEISKILKRQNKSYGSTYDLLIKNGIEFKHGRLKLPWHLFNWRLPNADLSRIWGISYFHVASNRYRCKLELPVYTARFGRRPDTQEYKDEVEKEQLKYEEWKKSQ